MAVLFVCARAFFSYGAQACVHVTLSGLCLAGCVVVQYSGMLRLFVAHEC